MQKLILSFKLFSHSPLLKYLLCYFLEKPCENCRRLIALCIIFRHQFIVAAVNNLGSTSPLHCGNCILGYTNVSYMVSLAQKYIDIPELTAEIIREFIYFFAAALPLIPDLISAMIMD